MQFPFHFAPGFLRFYFGCEVVSSPAFGDEAPAVLGREEEPRQSLWEPRPRTPPTCKDPRYGLEPEPWLNSSNDKGVRREVWRNQTDFHSVLLNCMGPLTVYS